MSRAFIVAVLCLAVFQFSENTADPDLWSHVFFGTQFDQTGKPTTTDYYSWTAYGQPSFDHEYLGEAVLGLAYLVLGGPGLLLFKVIVGMLTFGIALSIAAKRLDSKTKLIAWAFGALAVVEISFGFAARPQIFTAFLLAVELWILNQIHPGRWQRTSTILATHSSTFTFVRVHSGKWQWAFALPPLFALWFNLHGGALAGLILLFAAAGATSAQYLLAKFAPAKTVPKLNSDTSLYVIPALWLSAVVAAAAVVLNPHGFELARWLIGSVLWLRPQIEEWNPATLSWDHAAFFFCAAIAVAAFIISRRRRQLWEIAVLAILFVVAFRAVRNTPLFCVAALALVPPHLADVLQRFRGHFERIEELFKSPAMQKVSTLGLILLSAGIITATFTLHKKHFWTMEVPRAQYPVAAINFIQQHDLHGNLLAYFDWGEMCIWDLPDSRVSIDGRLDSVYSPQVIAAHWKLYNGEPFDTNVLKLADADFALLPSHLAGSETLGENDGWTVTYFDNLAVVLVKNPRQFSKLEGLTLPVSGGLVATEGRDAFPNHLPAR